MPDPRPVPFSVAPAGEVPLPDGTWRHPDGRIIDPRLGSGRLIPLNSAILYGLPLLVAVALPWYVLEVGLGLPEVVAGFLLWWFTGLGITAGYHRLFAHRGYKASAPVRLLMAIAGGMAAQNSVFAWASDHRYHHQQVDTIGDPYNALRGFWFSHFTWVLYEGAHQDDEENIADLHADPILRWQHRNYLWVVFGGNLLVCLLLGALTGRWIGMLLVAGLTRVLLVQHATFLINSAAHKWGTRPWSRSSTARDNWILSLLTFGEGYHNYHHAFAGDYRNGIRWYHWDPSKWLIWTIARLGLASDLQRVPADVTLRARFEERRRSLVDRMAGWGEGKVREADAWAARLRGARVQFADLLSERAEEVRGAFAERAEEARARIDDAQRALASSADELSVALQARAEGVRVAVDEAQAALQARAEEVRAALEDAQAALAGRADAARTAFRSASEEFGERLLAAESAVEEALTELRARRRALAALRRDATDGARRELKELRRAVARSSRRARVALEEWDSLVNEYIERFAPTAAAV